VKVVEGVGAGEPIPYARAELAKDAATPIEPGTVDTTAALTVTFAMN
jgi:uncharacterized protein YggE